MNGIRARAWPFLLAALLFAPGPAEACRCSPVLPPVPAWLGSEIVFTGRCLNSGDSLPAATHHGAALLSFRFLAAKYWKGAYPETLRVTTPREGGDCGYHFLAGESYLVYTERWSGTLFTSMCSRTAGLSRAAADTLEFVSARRASAGEDSARNLAEYLVAHLSEPDPAARAAYIAALGQVHNQSGLVVPALTRTLRSGLTQDRYSAADALSGLGPEAARAIPALAAATGDENRDVQISALRALAQMGTAAREAAPQVARTLASSEIDVRQAGLMVMAGLGPEGKSAVPALRKLLAAQSAATRTAAIHALLQIGPAAREAIPDLRRIADADESEQVRKIASGAAELLEDESMKKK